MASDVVTLPNGKTQEIDVVYHPGGAAVVALDGQQRVCLLRQYRVVFDDWFWELPAGKLDQQEPPLATAQRELQEEAGMSATLWEDLGHIVSSPGVFTEKVFLFLARQLTPGNSSHEDHEIMEVHWLPFTEAIAWCHNGKIVDAKSIAALLLVENRLQGLPEEAGYKC